ncbi:MAG: hypothetical protein KJ896_05630, partial [Nanoarchaeota archaeon]|nr:hypothetical protein [Nanoarchaeota archaeon]
EKEEKLANFVQELLELEGISSKHFTIMNKGERYIQITSWENYWKAYQIKLFDLNQRKKSKFVEFLNKRRFYCCVNDELKSLILKDTNKRKLSILLNRNYNAVSKRMRKNNVESEDLVKMCLINQIPLGTLRTNIIGVKTWGSKIIEDKELINFVIDKYLPDKLKDKKTWLP